MTGQEKGDCLIEVITWEGLTICLFYFQVDPFHTLFGICGLSLLGEEKIKPVNPVFCMPEEVIRRNGIQLDLL